MTKKIRLPIHGILIELDEEDPESDGVKFGKPYLGGTLTSRLHDGTGAEPPDYLAAVNAVESMILAHAMAGVDVESPAYLEGIEVAVDKIAEEYL